jgi:ribosome-associated toxin RatA of RatAB toxin-antitoxin module
VTQRIERSVDIDAPLSLVYRVIADVAAYPQFLPGVQRVRQEGDRFEMTVRLGPLDVTWTSRAILVPDTSIDVQLVRGPFRRMDVRWTFEEREGQTRVHHVTEFELDLPLPGVRGLVARAIAANVEATVHAFHRRVRSSQVERS